MGRPELGTKCTCTGCLERFYDLNRSPAVCPKCGTQQRPEKPRAFRPSRSTFGTGPQPRQSQMATTIDDDVEPADTSEVEAELDEPDDVDDDTEVDPTAPDRSIEVLENCEWSTLE